MKPHNAQKRSHHILGRQRSWSTAPLGVVIVLITLAIGFYTAGPGIEVQAEEATPLQLQLAPVTGGFDEPIGIVNAGDLRLFVLEKKGVIKIINTTGQVEPQPFLNISDRVFSSTSETGLLGLAFHPGYFANGYFYVNYTNQTGSTLRTRISRFQVTADPNVADPSSEEVLLTVEQPVQNHNAGHLMFGRDGLLYIPLGDGGGFGGVLAQDPANLLGSIVRINVNTASGGPADCPGDGSGAYTVPEDNPWFDGPGGDCDEIWAIGLRNPWRSSFDRLTGDLYIADVGERDWEEVDYQPAGSPGGQNYGWPCYEGNTEFNATGCEPKETYTFPIFEYDHGEGCSITGGYVYRGNASEGMAGRYFLTDFCSGAFWDLAHNPNDTWTATKHSNLAKPWSYAAIGEACDGELYVADKAAGAVLHLQESNAASSSGNAAPILSEDYGLLLDEYLYLPIVHAPWCRPF